MKLIDQIARVQRDVFAAEARVRQLKDDLHLLMKQQMQCAHTFTPALKGYEHEGGQCTECGINEVYWAHNRP